MNTASQRAAHGAEMLDYARPGWHREIDLDSLDVAGFYSCVLGQLYGDWYQGTARLGLYCDESDAYGFTVRSRWQSYRALTRAWRREAQARLASDERDKQAQDSVTNYWMILDEAADFPVSDRELVGSSSAS